jgi:hypothetical protein
MIPRIRWVSFALLALLTTAPACLAAEGEPAHRPGQGGIGGQLGGSYFGVDRMFGADWFADYSKWAMPRFSFAGQFRYVHSKHLRWQVSPGFTWTAYKTATEIPFPDLNYPDDQLKVKDNMLVLLLPTTAQLQYVVKRGQWLYHAGAGPGVYRVWVENRRIVLKDPSTFRLHRGPYPGGSFEIGAERFLKSITTTSVEFVWVNHLVLAQRDEQFPNGYNSNLMATELRVGLNYYFDPLRQKKQGIEILEAK